MMRIKKNVFSYEAFVAAETGLILAFPPQAETHAFTSAICGRINCLTAEI